MVQCGIKDTSVILSPAWLRPQPPTAELARKDNISIEGIFKNVLFYPTESLTCAYFEISSKTIQHGDLSFDNNHDLFSVSVFIFQAKHLI